MTILVEYLQTCSLLQNLAPDVRAEISLIVDAVALNFQATPFTKNDIVRSVASGKRSRYRTAFDSFLIFAKANQLVVETSLNKFIFIDRPSKSRNVFDSATMDSLGRLCSFALKRRVFTAKCFQRGVSSRRRPSLKTVDNFLSELALQGLTVVVENGRYCLKSPEMNISKFIETLLFSKPAPDVARSLTKSESSLHFTKKRSSPLPLERISLLDADTLPQVSPGRLAPLTDSLFAAFHKFNKSKLAIQDRKMASGSLCGYQKSPLLSSLEATFWNVVSDGNCGFRAIALDVYGDQSKWPEVRRAMALQELRAAEKPYFFQNLNHFEINCAPRFWIHAGMLDLAAAAFDRIFIILSSDNIQNEIFFPPRTESSYRIFDCTILHWIGSNHIGLIKLNNHQDYQLLVSRLKN